MSKKKNRNEDTIKNFKKAISNFLSLLSEKKIPFLISVTSNILSTFLVVAIPWVSALAIDDIVSIMNDTTVTNKWEAISSFIIKPVSALGIIAILIFVLSYLQEYLSAILGEQIAQSLRMKLSNKLTKLPMNFFDTNQVGDILSKITTDIEKIAEVIVTGFTRFIYSFLIIVLVIIMLLRIDIKLTTIVLGILFISVIVTYFVSKLTQKIFAKNVTTLSELSTITEEALTGNLVIQSYNKQKDILDILDKSIEEQYSAGKTLEFTIFSIYPSIRFITQIAFVISAVMSAILVINGHLTLGLAQAFLQYVTQISDPVTTAAYIINSLQNALVSVERIYDILELPEEIDLAEDTHLLDDTKGQISFENVSFGYTKDKLLMKNVNFTAKAEQMVAIVGPTGAGKTTLFNLLTGVYEPSEGTVTLDGHLLNGKAPYKIASLGLGRTFQNIRLFKDLTVLDNVLIAFGNHHKPHAWASFFRLPVFYKTEEDLKNKALDLLKIFDLDKEAETLAKNLAYGQQRRLEIVRALATEPKILFLDEPAAGMNPQETAELTALIRRIKNEFNITIMLIEHDMSLVMEVTERIYVLEYGRLIAHGTPDEIKTNERVIEAYLGGEA